VKINRYHQQNDTIALLHYTPSVLYGWSAVTQENKQSRPHPELIIIMSAQVKIVPLLHVHQRLMLFAGTLTYLETKMFALIVFYNGPCIILKH
jgi:hypothetical protein